MSIVATGRPSKHIPHYRSNEDNVIEVEHSSPQNSSSFPPHDFLSDMVEGIKFYVGLDLEKYQDLA